MNQQILANVNTENYTFLIKCNNNNLILSKRLQVCNYRVLNFLALVTIGFRLLVTNNIDYSWAPLWEVVSQPDGQLLCSTESVQALVLIAGG